MVSEPELARAVRALPLAARRALADFVEYLQYKYGATRPGDVVRLGGLWADIGFDPTDEDIRALRQRVTARIRDSQSET